MSQARSSEKAFDKGAGGRELAHRLFPATLQFMAGKRHWHREPTATLRGTALALMRLADKLDRAAMELANMADKLLNQAIHQVARPGDLRVPRSRKSR